MSKTSELRNKLRTMINEPEEPEEEEELSATEFIKRHGFAWSITYDSNPPRMDN